MKALEVEAQVVLEVVLEGLCVLEVPLWIQQCRHVEAEVRT